jgi:hypothetical protein
MWSAVVCHGLLRFAVGLFQAQNDSQAQERSGGLVPGVVWMGLLCWL